MPNITKLGKYLIRRKLGKGAMGIVYEGFDPVLARAVAIKTILPAQLDSSEVVSVLARFKREAQAAGRLNHPGIVAVYEYGEVDAEDDHTMAGISGHAPLEPERVAFIAMEFVKGRELRSYFDADERFSLKDVGRIMGDILDALGHAHGKGVTHRDIKPANLIMLDDGRVKIADFGIARIESSQLTVAGTVMGTPSYMSPEQFQGQTVDLRSDLFSCGIILYQFLTGEKPFVGTLTSIMFKVLRDQPLPPTALNAALSAAWDRLIDKAIAKNPDDRFQSAQSFAAAIQELLLVQPQPQPQPQRTPGAVQVPFSAPPQPAAPKPPQVSQVPQAPQASPVLASSKASRMALVLLGLLLLGGAGIYLWREDGVRGIAPAAAISTQREQTTPLVPAPAPIASPALSTSQPVLPIPVPVPVPQPVPEPVAPALIPTSTPPVTPPVTSTPQVIDRPVPANSTPNTSPPVKRPARKSVIPPDASARPAVERPPARSPRCALILQKAAVSEPISAEERNFLTSSCQ